MASKWEVTERYVSMGEVRVDTVRTFNTMEEALEYGERWDELNRKLGLDDIITIVSEVEVVQ